MANVTTTNTTNMVFLEKRVWQKNESTKPMVFVTLADQDSFERFEFIADQTCDLNFDSKVAIIPTFKMSNYNNRASFTLTSLVQKK